MCGSITVDEFIQLRAQHAITALFQFSDNPRIGGECHNDRFVPEVQKIGGEVLLFLSSDLDDFDALCGMEFTESSQVLRDEHTRSICDANDRTLVDFISVCQHQG